MGLLGEEFQREGASTKKALSLDMGENAAMQLLFANSAPQTQLPSFTALGWKKIKRQLQSILG